MRTGNAENQLLSVTIRDRDGIIFEGRAESLTSYNKTGEFDILPLHTNFISIINDNIALRLEGGALQNLPLKTGILKVSNDKVEVYLGIIH